MPTEPKAEQVKENETELQPDPLMKEGRASRVWVWVVGIFILAVIVVYFIAVGSS